MIAAITGITGASTVLKVLGFLFSPKGRIVLLALAIVAGWGHGYWKGHSHASGACAEAALRAELAAVRRDMAIAESRAQDAAEKAARLDTRAGELQQEVQSYADELASRENAGCILNDSDLRRLRGIR